MTTPGSDDETAIRQQIGRLAASIRAMDLEAVRGFYAGDIVSFDFEAPLAIAGVEVKLGNWGRIFAQHRPPLGYEVRDLVVVVHGDVAFAHSLNRISGTRHDGTQAGHWVRCTNCLRRIGGQWRIVHDHVSVPADARSGRALLDLTP